MKFLMNKDEGKKEFAVKLMCLILAVVMFLSSCGKDNTSSTAKKKKKVIVIQYDSSDVQDTSSGSSEDNSSYEETVFEQENEEEEDEGEDLKKESVVDRSNRKSSVPAQYSKLVWSDEFNGDKLDSNIWSYDYFNGTKGDKITSTDSKYLSVKNGELIFKGDRYFDPYNPDVTYVDTPTIATKYSMNFLYGYVEMCAKLPFCSGAWPALWTRTMISTDTYTGTDPAFMAEVDIFECFGSKDTIVPSLHKWFTKVAQGSGMPAHTQIGDDLKATYTFEESENLKNEYHVYGWEWTPEYMAMYVDGEEYNRFGITDADSFDEYGGMSGFRVPMHLLIGSGAITPESSADWLKELAGDIKDEDFPYEMKVDYIRVYQNPNEAQSKLILSE